MKMTAKLAHNILLYGTIAACCGGLMRAERRLDEAMEDRRQLRKDLVEERNERYYKDQGFQLKFQALDALAKPNQDLVKENEVLRAELQQADRIADRMAGRAAEAEDKLSRVKGER